MWPTKAPGLSWQQSAGLLLHQCQQRMHQYVHQYVHSRCETQTAHLFEVLLCLCLGHRTVNAHQLLVRVVLQARLAVGCGRRRWNGTSKQHDRVEKMREMASGTDALNLQQRILSYPFSTSARLLQVL